MPANMVNIVTKPSMFRPDLYYTRVPDGATIADVVGPGIGSDVAVLVNDTLVPHESWAFTRVFHEDIVSIAILPEGDGEGGKNPLRTVAMIAVMVVAAYVGGPMMAAMGLKGTIAGGLTWGAVGSGILMTGGMMAVNALIPPPSPATGMASALPEIGSPAAAFSITGGQNRSRPYSVVQKLFGFTRFFPDLAANPYTEIRGNDQYFCMLLSAGYANVALSDFRIGDTPISAFQDTRWEVGYMDEITLFRRNALENSESVKIDQGESILRSLADGETGHEISVDLCFAQGLRSVSEEGEDGWAEVRIRVEFSEAGAGAWQVGADQAFTMTARDPVRETIRFSASTAAQGIDLRITHVSVSHQYAQYTFTTCYITAVRALKSGPAVVDPGRKFLFIALEIRATDQINGVVDNVSCYGESYLPVYNGTNWIYQKTNNPAWAYAEACHGEQLAHPVPYAKLDGPALKDWADWCTANGFTYNNVHDTDATMLDHLGNIAAAGRASRSITEGLFSVVRDTLELVPAQMISPRNSWGFKAKKVFPDPPHALKVKYVDPAGLAEVTRVVYADGYDEATATKFEELPTVGCQDPDMAWKHGRYYLADMILRPEEYQVSMDWENLRCRRGSLVCLAHDVMRVGISWGRLRRVVDAVTVESDELLPFEESKSYVVRFHKSDGTQVLVAVTGTPGYTDTLTLGAAVSGLAAGDHFIFGEAGKESMDAKVKRIAYHADLSADLTLVPAAPEILAADQGPIPAFDPLMTGPVNPRFVAPPIPELVFFEAYESVAGASVAPQLVVGFHVPAGSPAARTVQVSHQHNGTWQTASADAADGVIPLADLPPEGTVMEFKVRARSAHNVWSQWSAPVTYTLSFSQVIQPQTVTGFTAAAVTDGIRLSWDNIVALQVTRYKVRAGASFEAGTPVFEGLADAFTDKNRAAGARIYWIVSVNPRRVSLPASAQITVDPPAAPAVTTQISEGLAMLAWDDCMTTFPIRHYEVVSGADVHYISNTQYAEKVTWTGDKNFIVQAVDSGGNLSAETLVTLAAPGVTAVTGLTAAGSVHSIVIRADYTLASPEEIEAVEIHGATVNNRASAMPITSLAPGTHSHVHPGIPLLETWYYWARIRNRAKVHSDWYPSGATAGVQGTPSDDPADYVKMFDAMVSDGDLLSQFAWASLKDFFEWEGTGTYTISDGNEAVGLAHAVVNGLGAIEQRMIALDTAGAPAWVSDPDPPYGIGAVVIFSGKYFRAIKPVPNGIDPTNPAYWTAMTAGILNQWVLRMNANGHVAGMGMTLDDSGDSEFIIQADKFAVVTDDPGAPGTPMSMFQVGLVNGVTMVGIRGDLMIDGSVGAKAMKTDELYIGMTMQSLNYIAGVSGWKWDKNGAVEIVNGSIHLGPGSSGYNNLGDTPDVSANWSGEAVPTLANEPAVNWATEAARAEHLDDTYLRNGKEIYQFSSVQNAEPPVALAGVLNASAGADAITALPFAASAVSTTSYTGGAYLAFKVGALSEVMAAGLSQNPTADNDPASIEFAWHFTPGSPDTIRIIESGSLTLISDDVAIDPEDVFFIHYDGADVTYGKNGTGVHTSTAAVPANATFYIDSHLGGSNDQVLSIRFASESPLSEYTLAAVPSGPSLNAAGDAVVGTHNQWFYGDYITMGYVEGAIPVGSGSGYSSQSYTGSCLLEFKVAGTQYDVTCGISQNPTQSISWSDIEFGLSFTTSSVVVRESGSIAGAGNLDPSPDPDDLWSINYDGSAVTYFKNRQLVYTSQATVPANAAFYMDSFLISDNERIDHIMFGPTPLTPPGQTPGVTLSNVINTSVGVDAITADPYAASGASTTSYTGGIFLEFRVGTLAAAMVCGLSQDPTADNDPDSMEFAWKFTPGSPDTIQVVESGALTLISDDADIEPEDRFAVYYDGADVKYYKNRSLVHTSTAAVPGAATFFLDSHLLAEGDEIAGISLWPEFFEYYQPSYAWVLVATNDRDIRSPSDPALLDPVAIDPSRAYTVGDPVNGPYAVFNAGEITFYQWFAGVLRAIKTLKQVDGAIIESGQWYTLEGYWANPPSVYAFSVDTMSYHYSYSAQSQKMRLGMTDVEQVSDGIYRVKGDSFLESQAGSAVVSPGLSCSGSSAANTASYGLPSNTRKITANLRFSGCCGEWFDGDLNRCYIYIRAKLVYYTNGAWIDSPWTPVYLVTHSSNQPAVITTPTTAQDITQAYLYVEKYSNTRIEYQAYTGTNYIWGALDTMTCSLAGGAVITLGHLGIICIGE